tara:strand:- start:304 stop:1308 length:1005 start_codon:yes stop_codon:yes gene_type:complete
MDYRGGLATELNQANNLTQSSLAQQANVDVVNNLRTRDYNDAIDKKKETRERQTKEDEKNAFEKLGEYGTEVGNKYAEYNKFITEGGNLDNLKSTRFAQGVGSAFGKAGSSVKTAVMGAPKPSVDGIEVSGTEMTGDITQQHTTPQPEQNTPDTSAPEEGGGDASSGDATTQGAGAEAGEAGAEAGEAGAEAGEEIAQVSSTAGKLAKGAMRVGGGLFSVGMLGTDIYQQASQGKFFVGENTGDKIGNFMSELGSGADVLGVASADPLLAIAGVGLGAVGSVVSDISELFHHHEDKKNAPPPPPAPKPIQAQAIQSIAGSGQVGEVQASAIRSN